MERKLSQGDYLPGAQGDFQLLDGAQALLQRVLFRLTARRGQFPFLPEMGSRLYQLCREGKPSARAALALSLIHISGQPAQQVPPGQEHRPEPGGHPHPGGAGAGEQNEPGDHHRL